MTYKPKTTLADRERVRKHLIDTPIAHVLDDLSDCEKALFAAEFARDREAASANRLSTLVGKLTKERDEALKKLEQH